MKQLPFIIQKIVFRQDACPTIVDMDDTTGQAGEIPGYFVMSSAPPNIEDAQEASPEIQQQAATGIQEIADHLYRMGANSPDGSAELIIVVHGYNTDRDGVEDWYKTIFKFVNHRDDAIHPPPNRLLIGYRWPSENIALSNPTKIWQALTALPPLPRDLLITGGLGALLLLILELWPLQMSVGLFLVSLALAGLLVLGLWMSALVLLRLVGYFRDSYRADNFGVSDLVELLRQIDQNLVQRTAAEMFPQAHTAQEQVDATRKAQEHWKKAARPKIKLSFVGHSMGAFVVTNVIRILSDVFDPRSVSKHPTSDIGDIYRLERLVLASPDIPVLTIISSRANFLASSLRRFSESYLFSSEGDIALRIASTAANYIAFPSRTQARGYRLGNVALRNRSEGGNPYGLVNLADLDRSFSKDLPIGAAIAQSQDNVLEELFLTSERSQKNRVLTLAHLFKVQADGDSSRATVADFFTYFDCTDYVDIKYDFVRNTGSTQPMGLLTRAKGRPVLRPWDYLLLTLDYATDKRDVHGGYFQGQFSQQLLYRLAFLGFRDYLETLDGNSQVALSKLHLMCREKGIQGHLSPFRYRVDIQGGSLEGTKTDMLEAISTND
jgi:pimeloyl-ACP methyl ester carboxylesterase